MNTKFIFNEQKGLWEEISRGVATLLPAPLPSPSPEPSCELLEGDKGDTLPQPEADEAKPGGIWEEAVKALLAARAEDTKALPFMGAYRLSPDTARRMAQRLRRKHWKATGTHPRTIKARHKAKERERQAKRYAELKESLFRQWEYKEKGSLIPKCTDMRRMYKARKKANPDLIWDVDLPKFRHWAQSVLDEEGIWVGDITLRRHLPAHYVVGNIGIKVLRGVRAGEFYVWNGEETYTPPEVNAANPADRAHPEPLARENTQGGLDRPHPEPPPGGEGV